MYSEQRFETIYDILEEYQHDYESSGDDCMNLMKWIETDLQNAPFEELLKFPVKFEKMVHTLSALYFETHDVSFADGIRDILEDLAVLYNTRKNNMKPFNLSHVYHMFD